MSTPLLDRYYPEHQVQSKTRTLDLLISDLWHQYPRRPSTFSACASDGCSNFARGGHLCRECTIDVLAELVGLALATRYAEAVREVSRAQFAMKDALENVQLSDRHE